MAEWADRESGSVAGQVEELEKGLDSEIINSVKVPTANSDILWLLIIFD